MHPSSWLMIKGEKPETKISMAGPVPADMFAETHTWIKGQVKGRIALLSLIHISEPTRLDVI
eukprot:3537377-Prorocentrum_lima.AAC.1